MISFDDFATDTSTAVYQDYITFPEHMPKEEQVSFKTLAKKVNKAVNGSKYKLISDPEEFVEPYKRRVENALKSTDPEESSFACSCNYNVEEIKRPKLCDGKLVFYVHSKKDKFPIPQRVTCDNPTSLQHAKITCESLPYVK